jgi:uncharacterized protein with PIN domain
MITTMNTTDENSRRGNGQELRFVVDFMAGRLATWLRVLGFDAVYLGRPADPEIMRIALTEDRLVLTRNRQLAGTERPRVVVLESETVAEQLAELNARFRLVHEMHPFTRCAECNAELVHAARSRARDRVPPYIFETHAEFGYCPDCDKFYWRGSHWTAMRRNITQLERRT